MGLNIGIMTGAISELELFSHKKFLQYRIKTPYVGCWFGDLMFNVDAHLCFFKAFKPPPTCAYLVFKQPLFNLVCRRTCKSVVGQDDRFACPPAEAAQPLAQNISQHSSCLEEMSKKKPEMTA
jgi:hypothetical protein